MWIWSLDTSDIIRLISQEINLHDRIILCCAKKKGSVAKVKSGKRENHMVVDAKQGYNLFLMWEETSEFWHKQQPTFVKISWTSKKHYGEKWQEKSNFWFLSIFGGKIQIFCYIIFFSNFVNFWYRNSWKMRLLRIFSTKMFSLLFCCQPPSKILSQKRSSWVNALWPTTCGFTSSIMRPHL